MTQVSTFQRTAVSSAWVDLLRTNCFVLTERPNVAKAISVSRAFRHGREAERDAVIALAQRMAEEYGLLAEIEVHGYYLTIRLARVEQEANAEEPEVSLISKVRSLWNARRQAAKASTGINEAGSSAAGS